MLLKKQMHVSNFKITTIKELKPICAYDRRSEVTCMSVQRVLIGYSDKMVCTSTHLNLN